VSLPAPASAAIVERRLTPPQPKPPAVTVPAATLGTLDGDVELWSRRPDTRRRVASTIKMLNALVVRETADLDEVVVVTPKAAAIWDGEVGLVAGQKLTVNQLLQMMLVASANDAAEALAIHISGTEAAYVRAMNAKARQLGLTRTRATDPHGLGKREYSTARDLTVLAREVMKDPVPRRIAMQRSVSVPRPGAKPRIVKSTDLLLGAYPGIEGVKTGFTNPAGYCFVSAAKRGNVELVGVVLGAKSNAARFAETRRLLDWGFAHYRNRVIVSTDETAGTAPVLQGVDSSVTIHPASSFAAVEFDGDPYDRVFRVATSTVAPVAPGQHMGVVLVVHDRSVVATIPLVADRAVVAAPVPERSVAPSAIVGISKAIERFVDFWGSVTGLGKSGASAPARRPATTARTSGGRGG
jgi:D-alanyl-D-alanine carboxypeptidase (penicillin-binding protein 5/6)